MSNYSLVIYDTFDEDLVPFADGTVVHLFNANQNVASATPVDTQSTLNGVIQTTKVSPENTYQYTIVGNSAYSATYTFRKDYSLIQTLTPKASVVSTPSNSSSSSAPHYYEILSLYGPFTGGTSGTLLIATSVVGSFTTKFFTVTNGYVHFSLTSPIPTGFDYWRVTVKASMENVQSISSTTPSYISLGALGQITGQIDSNKLSTIPASGTGFQVSCESSAILLPDDAAQVTPGFGIYPTNINLATLPSLITCSIEAELMSFAPGQS